MVAAGIPWGVAIGFAPVVLQIISDNTGITGVDVSIEYYYGEDNHGGIGWTPGPVTVEGY